MRKVYGIHINEEGKTVAAAFSMADPASAVLWTRVLDGKGILKKPVLLDQGVTLGVPSSWVRSSLPVPEGFCKGDGDGEFAVYTQNSFLDIQCDNFRNNLLGAVPGDAFLCTLPCHFGQFDSFISLYEDGKSLKIGITLQKQLKAVFTFPAGDDKHIEGNLARIERYWAVTFPGSELPRTIVQINGSHEIRFEGYEIINITPFNSSNYDILHTAGVALSNERNCTVPRFRGMSPECRFRRKRSAVLIAGVLLSAISIATATVVLVTGLFYDFKLGRCEQEYRNLLSNNPAIRSSLRLGDSLSSAALHLESTMSKTTRWARLLENIGSSRPPGLYFERLGSEPANESSLYMRIALAGWADQETIVTEFMKKLQGLPFIKDASLASMERDPDPKNLCRFKVICTLKLEKE